MSLRWFRTAALGVSALTLVAVALPSGAGAATVTSFDGTKLHVNFFPAARLAPGHRAATVMMGPGWGSAGDTKPGDSTDPTSGIPGVGTLRRAGFNVLTWDPRGFGKSGGTVEVDSPSYEGRDVSAMISWLARRPQALLDRKGDPRVGMAGGSYGGGIQLVAAGIDRRIDAIVPDIAWNSLVTSLYKQQTVKLGWSSLLYATGKAAGRLNPIIGESYQAGAAGGRLSPAEVSFYRSRGPGSLVGRIRVPTLLVQGTVDDLFTLQEAVTNYAILRRHGVPAKMLWFCGGHGVCLTKPGNTKLITTDTVAWLRRYLDRDTHVKTGPTFEWVDQDGREHTAGDYPLAAGASLTATGSGTLPITAAGGAGPAKAPPGSPALAIGGAAVAPALATNAVNVQLPAPGTTREVIGAPRLTVSYTATGTAPAGTSTRVYAQVVDDATGKVLGNQITPVPIVLDGAPHTVSLPLEILAASDRPGEHFTLQLTASTVAYETQRATGTVSFSRIAIALPTARPGAAPLGYGRIGPDGCTADTAVIRLPARTRTAVARLGGRVVARGRRVLRVRLVGRGPAGTVTLRVSYRTSTGRSRTLARPERICP